MSFNELSSSVYKIAVYIWTDDDLYFLGPCSVNMNNFKYMAGIHLKK